LGVSLLIKIAFKLLFAIGIVYWLIESEKLQLEPLELYWRDYKLIAMSIFVFVFGFAIGQSIRWNLLLTGLGIGLSHIKALRLQLIGFFFNVAMPGAVGGDIIKALYVAKEKGSKTKSMSVVLFDRILGMVSLFFLTGLVSIFNYESIIKISALQPLLVLIWCVIIGILVLFSAVFVFRDRDLESLKILKLKFPGVTILKQILDSFWSFRNKPGILVSCILIGATIQFFFGFIFYYVAYRLNGQWPDFGIFATVFPFGVLIASVPLAPGGLGVGHAGFEKVFSLAGIDNGANIFNVIILGQLLLNLTGAVPYLFFKSSDKNLQNLNNEIVN
jgi:glycosyltransferase 2 family protein